jgi:hypothetical protein
MTILRRSDLTNEAINLGIWEGLKEMAGSEGREEIDFMDINFLSIESQNKWFNKVRCCHTCNEFEKGCPKCGIHRSGCGDWKEIPVSVKALRIENKKLKYELQDLHNSIEEFRKQAISNNKSSEKREYKYLSDVPSN